MTNEELLEEKRRIDAQIELLTIRSKELDATISELERKTKKASIFLHKYVQLNEHHFMLVNEVTFDNYKYTFTGYIVTIDPGYLIIDQSEKIYSCTLKDFSNFKIIPKDDLIVLITKSVNRFMNTLGKND